MPVNFDLSDLCAFRAPGLKLFEHTTRGMLTLKGQAFAGRSTQLLANFEAVMADLSEVSAAVTIMATC